MFKYIFNLIIFLFCTSLSYAEKNTQSVIDSLNKLEKDEQIIFLHYTFGNSSHFIEHKDKLNYLLKVLENNKWDNDKLVSVIQFYKKIAPSIIEKNLNRRIELLFEYKTNTQRTDYFYPILLHQIGMNYYVNNEYAKGLEFLIKAKNKFYENGYELYPEAGVYLHDLALVFYNFKKYEDCIKLMHKALQFKSYSPNLDIQRYNNLANAYLQLNISDSAEYYNLFTYKRALSYNDTIWMIIPSINTNNDSLFDSGIRIFNQWIKNKNLQEYSEIYFLYNKIKLLELKTLLKRNQIIDAQKAYKSINLHPHSLPEQQLFQSSVRNREYLKLYYKVLYEYHFIQKDYIKAINYSDSANNINNEIEKSFNELLLNVANDQLFIAQKNNMIEKVELKRKNNILIFSFIIIFLCALLIFALYSKSKKQKLAVELKLRSEQLQYQIALKNKELELAQQHINFSLQKLKEKNEIIDKIQIEFDKLHEQQSSNTNEILALEDKIVQLKETRILTDEDWIEFQKNYATINKALFDNLRTITPKLTEAEIRYLMLVSLELTNKDIANILGISPDSLRVTWNRIKKKYPNQNFENAKKMLQSIHLLLNTQ